MKAMDVLNCISDFSTSYGLFLSLFLAGLMGGFTHCAGMCSPFVLAQTSSAPQLKRISDSLLLPYHLGRMTTYVVLAVIFSSVLNLALLFSDARALVTGPLLLLAGLLFLASAFPAIGKVFPWALKVQLLPPIAFFGNLVGRLASDANMLKRYFLGVLLGFMPCGLVVSAILAASTAETPVQSALAMGGFALGTMPALMFVGLGAKSVLRKYPNISTRVSQGAMVVSSFWLFALAGLVLTEYWKF